MPRAQRNDEGERLQRLALARLQEGDDITDGIQSPADIASGIEQRFADPAMGGDEVTPEWGLDLREPQAEQAELNQKAAPDMATQAPPARSPLMAQPQPQAQPQASGPREPTDEEQTDAEERANRQRLFAGLGRAGANLGAAIGRTKADTSFWDAMDARSGEGVQALDKRRELVRQYMKDKLTQDAAGREAESHEFNLGQARKSAASSEAEAAEQKDATSPASQFYRDFFAQYMPDLKANLPSFDALSAAQLVKVAPHIAKQAEESFKRDEGAKERSNRWAIARMNLSAAEAQRGSDRDFQRELAGMQADARTQEREAGLKVPGYERSGDVLPTQDEAKKFRTKTAAGNALLKSLDEMEALYKAHGTQSTLSTDPRTEMKSIRDAMNFQLDALTESNLISAKNSQRIKDTIPDPTATWQGIKGLAGMDDTAGQIKKLRDLVRNELESSAGSLGYKSAGKPTGGDLQGARGKMPKDAGGEVRMIAPDGTSHMVAPGMVEAAIKKGGRRADG
jgi:hypothetical protein